MATIAFMMSRAILAQGLSRILSEDSNHKIYVVPHYEDVPLIVSGLRPEVLLIEAEEVGAYEVQPCLSLCEQVRQENPQAQILFMCSERSESDVASVIQAKQQHTIDDFVFYDASLMYLISKIHAMVHE